ncbi:MULTISPECIES: aspartyl/asparaginyl beta-hydroxylase domain-containing protein [Pseudomonas]|uniref:aspartyl/asparaginyl beta-hydroxylase domain-containing protein n=1 Tax=Pseudomonadaceae TaxID=135621 RepID=UPI0004294962|nr:MULTISPECIES: aspartyl/asparaginyl beta-hydroxylase domain-containing protein [Pseudomonas]MDE3740001.1 aspartyl/asparaginyl beta-hydroxylase domain-containing protein [Pseudomonas resinovorans]
MPTPTLPVCSRLLFSVELAPLLQALARVEPGAWQGHFNTGYYEGDWSGVALITPEDAPLPLAPGQGAPKRSTWWQGEAAWNDLLGAFRTRVRSARLLRLGPGSRIHEHCDPDLGMPGSDLRLHVPLLSPAGVEFLVDGLQVPMQPGECWFLDLSRPHRVDNPGPGERIHLVLDCQPNDWLLDAIKEGLPDTPALQLGRAGQAFAQFRRSVEGDAALARQLQGLTDVREFIRETVALGAEQGLEFSEAEVRGAMRQGKQAWSDQWRV